MGGGSNSTSSSSRPLTAGERSDLYHAGMRNIASYAPEVLPGSTPQYESPTYVSPAFQAGGYKEGLDYAKNKDMVSLDNSLAKRGIWSSGLAVRAGNDLASGYAPAYEKAAADQATAQNSFNLQNAGTQNTFNLQNANQKYQSKWQPANYAAGIWNGTSGAISSGSGGGWNFSI